MTQDNPEIAAPNLTLQDVAAVVQIFRILTSRGVWKAGELSTVGNLYDRLTKFLEAAGVQLESEFPDQDQETKEST